MFQFPSISVPRKSSLFQSDIYPDTLSTKPAMTVNDWFVLGSNAKPLMMSMQKDIPSSYSIKRTITNGTSTLGRTKQNEEKDDEKSNAKYKRQASDLVIERNKMSSADNNITKKYEFLSISSAPDYRPYSYGERVQNKQDKTNTNQSTKIQQLKSIFTGGQTTVVTTTTSTNKENGLSIIESSLENSNLVHTENEVSGLLIKRFTRAINLNFRNH